MKFQPYKVHRGWLEPIRFLGFLGFRLPGNNLKNIVVLGALTPNGRLDKEARE